MISIIPKSYLHKIVFLCEGLRKKKYCDNRIPFDNHVKCSNNTLQGEERHSIQFTFEE